MLSRRIIRKETKKKKKKTKKKKKKKKKKKNCTVTMISRVACGQENELERNGAPLNERNGKGARVYTRMEKATRARGPKIVEMGYTISI